MSFKLYHAESSCANIYLNMVKNRFIALLTPLFFLLSTCAASFNSAFLFLPAPVFAEQISDQKVCTEVEGLNQELLEAAGCYEQTSSSDLIIRIIKILLFVVGFFSVVMIIVSGVKLMLASDVATAKKSRDMIIYSSIGLIISILALVIVRTVSYFAYNV